MKAQLIHDYNGKPTGVFISYKDWELIKKNFPNIEYVEDDTPQWHKDIIDKRLKDYHENPNDVVDFETTIANIRKKI